MTALKKSRFISAEEYLAGDPDAPKKREYLDGLVFLKPDEINLHYSIVSQIFVSIACRLNHSIIELQTSITKIHIQIPPHERFYHPDISLIRRADFQNEIYQEKPMMIVEVASPLTRRIDFNEKTDQYIQIASLLVYMIVEQSYPGVILYRRVPDGFVREEYEGLEAIIPLPEIEAELPLAEVYARVEFLPEPTDEEPMG